MTAGEIADLLSGEVEGDRDVVLHQFDRVEDATKGSLTFLANLKYESHLYDTEASAVLVQSGYQVHRPVQAALIRVDNVYESLAQLLQHFGNEPVVEPGISSKASVHPTAQLGKNVFVGDYAVIEAKVQVGDGTHIHAQVYVGQGCQIGAQCRLYPGAKVYHGCRLGKEVIIHANAVVGSDGFGYARGSNGFTKIQQTGNVIIEDQVEIGANSVVDRASIGSTIIRKGVKIDNLVQVAHNVEIGQHSAMAAQSGVAGSTKIGQNVLVGGQAGIVGHIHIGDGTEIQAQSGVTSNTEPGDRKYGSPALPYTSYLKSYAIFRKLPKISAAVHALQQRIRDLEKELRGLKSRS